MARKLTRREKHSITGASVLVGLFALLQFVVSPLLESRERTMGQLRLKTKELEEMMIARAEYDVINKNDASAMSRFTQRDRGFTLFSFLDRLARETGLKGRIESMKPSTSSPKDSPYRVSQVEMKLKNTTLKDLAAYLYRIETSENMVFVKRLSITKTTKQAGTIDAVMQVQTSEV